MTYLRKAEQAPCRVLIDHFQEVMNRLTRFPDVYLSPSIGKEFAGAQRLFRYCMVQCKDNAVGAVALAKELVTQWGRHDHWKGYASLTNVAHHAVQLTVELNLLQPKEYDVERDDSVGRAYISERSDRRGKDY